MGSASWWALAASTIHTLRADTHVPPNHRLADRPSTARGVAEALRRAPGGRAAVRESNDSDRAGWFEAWGWADSESSHRLYLRRRICRQPACCQATAGAA